MAQRFRLGQSEVEYDVAYRNIRYPRLEFKSGNLLLVLPRGYTDESDLLRRHGKWIKTRGEQIQIALEKSREIQPEPEKSIADFKDCAIGLVETLQKTRSAQVNHVLFRRMNSKWGSYSSRGNLTLNTLLRFLPDRLVRYVIFHELSHSVAKRHNRKFWKVVSREFPDHNKLEDELLVHWFSVQRVMKQRPLSEDGD